MSFVRYLGLRQCEIEKPKAVLTFVEYFGFYADYVIYKGALSWK